MSLQAKKLVFKPWLLYALVVQLLDTYSTSLSLSFFVFLFFVKWELFEDETICLCGRTYTNSH